MIYHNAFLIPTSDCIEKNNMPITHNGVVYDAHGRVIIESLRRSEFAAIKHVSDTYIDSNTVCCNTITEDAVYCGHFFGHFGHFLLETLPEIYRVKKSGSDNLLLFNRFRDDPSPTVLLKLKHVNFFLNVLKVERERIVIADKNLRLNNVEINDRVTTINHSIQPDVKQAYLFISEAIDSHFVYEKVYFSRSKMMRRPSPPDIDIIMANKGFKVIYPEKLSVYEQIQYVKNASVLAGYDGSAMHLSVFMKEASKVIIVDARPNRNTVMLNDLLNHETVYLENRYDLI